MPRVINFLWFHISIISWNCHVEREFFSNCTRFLHIIFFILFHFLVLNISVFTHISDDSMTIPALHLSQFIPDVYHLNKYWQVYIEQKTFITCVAKYKFLIFLNLSASRETYILTFTVSYLPGKSSNSMRDSIFA